MKSKDEVHQKLEEFMATMKRIGIIIERTRMDNAEEHRTKVQRLCRAHNVTIK